MKDPKSCLITVTIELREYAIAHACPYRKLYLTGAKPRNRAMLPFMGDMLKLIWCTVIGLFRSRASIEAEIVPGSTSGSP